MQADRLNVTFSGSGSTATDCRNGLKNNSRKFRKQIGWPIYSEWQASKLERYDNQMRVS